MMASLQRLSAFTECKAREQEARGLTASNIDIDASRGGQVSLTSPDLRQQVDVLPASSPWMDLDWLGAMSRCDGEVRVVLTAIEE